MCYSHGDKLVNGENQEGRICLCIGSYFGSELSYIGIISPIPLRINKKWVFVLAIVVVAALVIGIWAGAGCSEKDPNPTDAVATDPTGTPDNPAHPTDPVKPDDFTDPTDPSDPSTDPGTEPTDPSDGPPEVELNPDDKPTVGPTVPEDEDDDANEDNLVVDPGTTPTEPPKPPVSTDQFGGVPPPRSVTAIGSPGTARLARRSMTSILRLAAMKSTITS